MTKESRSMEERQRDLSRYRMEKWVYKMRLVDQSGRRCVLYIIFCVAQTASKGPNDMFGK